MSTLKFNKEKYLEIVKLEGISKALTQLQKDTMAWEYEAFEGPKGYQPQMIEELEAVRTFARELWDLDLHAIKT